VDGAHSHGHNGGGIPPELLMIVAIIAGVMLIGPIILAILNALITILFICLGTAAFALIGYVGYRLTHIRGTQSLPWQQRGHGREIQHKGRQALPPPRPNAEGFYVLTEREYRELHNGRGNGGRSK
jgi:hypothetical protein